MDKPTDDIDRERLERLLADPLVIVHRRTTRGPFKFESELRALPHVDVLDLLERRGPYDEIKIVVTDEE